MEIGESIVENKRNSLNLFVMMASFKPDESG
jgi:hypothetical protein